MLSRRYGFPASRAICVQLTTSEVVLCTPNADREARPIQCSGWLAPVLDHSVPGTYEFMSTRP